VPKDMMGRALRLVRPLAEEIAQAVDSRHGERLREGLRVAIAGPPNAGKSTLFNRLARREAAIVSPYPGTTRAVLEVHLDLGGYPVRVLDMGGIREREEPIEREGVRRASAQAADADLVLWLLDATAIGGSSSPAAPQPTHCRVWVAVNKIDLIGSIEKERIELRFNKELTVHFISSATGEGVDHLAAELSRFAGEFFPREPALVTRA